MNTTIEFQKQIDAQMEIYQMQLNDKIKRLKTLMEQLGINNKSKLEATLEFSKLFNELRNDGVIESLRDNVP